MNNIQKYLFCLVMLTSCKIDISFYNLLFPPKSTKLTFENNSWPHNEPFKFNFSIQDTSTAYDIRVVLKYDYSYPHYNLHLSYTIYSEKNQVFAKGVRDINLFDSFTGKSLGFSLYPNTKTIEFLILKDYKFSQPGKYSFELQHSMRILKLPGVRSIEFKLVSNKEII